MGDQSGRSAQIHIAASAIRVVIAPGHRPGPDMGLGIGYRRRAAALMLVQIDYRAPRAIRGSPKRTSHDQTVKRAEALAVIVKGVVNTAHQSGAHPRSQGFPRRAKTSAARQATRSKELWRPWVFLGFRPCARLTAPNRLDTVRSMHQGQLAGLQCQGFG